LCWQRGKKKKKASLYEKEGREASHRTSLVWKREEKREEEIPLGLRGCPGERKRKKRTQRGRRT